MPYPVVWVLKASCFIFVYRYTLHTNERPHGDERRLAYIPHTHSPLFSHFCSTPWLYQTGTVGTYVCVQALIMIYYGLLAVSASVEK